MKQNSHGARARGASLFDRQLHAVAAKQSVVMFKPWAMARNPVMFVTEVGAAMTTLVLLVDLLWAGGIDYTLAVAVILWITVLFANFAEALAEAGARRRRTR